APLVQNQDVYAWSDDVFKTKGAHSLKFGVLINRMRDRGLSSFDLTHNFSLNTIYRLPQVISAGGPAAGLLNGWWISGILRMNSGFPFTPALAANRSRSGVLGNQKGLDPA